MHFLPNHGKVGLLHVKLRVVFGAFFQMNFVKFPVVQVLSEHFFATVGSGAVGRNIFFLKHMWPKVTWQANGRHPKMQPFPTSSQMMSPAIVTYRSSHACAWKWRNFDIRGGVDKIASQSTLPRSKAQERGRSRNKLQHTCMFPLDAKNVCTVYRIFEYLSEFFQVPTNTGGELQAMLVGSLPALWIGPKEIRFRFRVSIKIFRLTQFFPLSPEGVGFHASGSSLESIVVPISPAQKKRRFKTTKKKVGNINMFLKSGGGWIGTWHHQEVSTYFIIFTDPHNSDSLPKHRQSVLVNSRCYRFESHAWHLHSFTGAVGGIYVLI